jgi:hypothetical protein
MLEKMLWFQESSISFLITHSPHLEPLFDVGEDALVPGVQHQLPHNTLFTWSLCLMLEKMLWFQESSISFLTTLSSPGASVLVFYVGEDALVPGVQHQLPHHTLLTWSLCLMLEKMLWFQESSINFNTILSLPGASV